VRQTQGQGDAGSGCGADAGAPLDAATLVALQQLDPEGQRGFLVKVLQAYLRSLERHLAALDEAQAVGDLRRAGEQAHGLKSSSASVGALALSAACAEVERRARAGDTTALGAPLRAIAAEAARASAAVRAMLAS
jgi:HPt (histidine-containing phosphotransfer) domain-containing protein